MVSSPGGLPEAPVPGGFWTEPGATVARLRRAYGDLFRLQVPSWQTVYCTAGEEAHKAFLIDQLDKLSNYDPLIPRGFMPPATAGGLITMDAGPEHRWFRKILSPPFSSASVAAHVPVFQDIVARRLRAWPRNGVIGLYGEMSAMAFHTTAAIVLGMTPADDVSTLRALFRDVTAHKPGSAARVAHELLPLIRARRDQPTNDAISCMIRSGGLDGPVSDRQIVAHVNTLMVAGHFTTAVLASYLLFLLVSHPRDLAQVLEEQLAIDSLDMQAIARMERLDDALMEAERIAPPVAHLVRGIVEDIEFQGHRLQAGEYLFCSVSGTHRDPKIFSDPDTFAPCRFAPPRSERRQHPIALAGFSVGARRCLGALLAQVTTKIMVHNILRGFTLHPEQASYPLIYHPVARPNGPMPFRVQARS